MAAKKTIPSPCISVCTMDDDNRYCLGCFRTLEEISRWEQADDAQRKTVLEAIALRRKRHIAIKTSSTDC